MLKYKMAKSRRVRGGRSKSRRSKRSRSSKSRSSNGIFSVSTLKSLVRLGVVGMVAMYLANWFMTLTVVSSTTTQIAAVTGLSQANIAYAVKGGTIATVALRFNKFLEKSL